MAILPHITAVLATGLAVSHLAAFVMTLDSERPQFWGLNVFLTASGGLFWASGPPPPGGATKRTATAHC